MQEYVNQQQRQFIVHYVDMQSLIHKKHFRHKVLIAYQHDISVATVKRALKTLSKYNIII